MAIGVLECLCALSASCRKKRLHLLSWMQGQGAPSRSCTEGLTGTNLTVALGKLHLDERFACVLDGCPARADPTLWTGDRLGFPIDGEVREIVPGLRLIPVCLEGWANQINSIAGLTLHKIGDRDIPRIDEMLIWEQILPNQVGMDRGEDPLIAERSRSGFDVGDQLWSIIITCLAKMDFVSEPECGPLLPIARVEIIGGVDELSCGQGWFWTPPSTLLS